MGDLPLGTGGWAITLRVVTMNIRIDELSVTTGTRVDTIRYYQSKGLLPPPRREGRVALYTDEHVERLGRIRDLKDKGFTLASIKRLLDGDLEEADLRLAETVLGAARHASSAGRLMPLQELAERTGVSATLLEAVEREGLIEAVVENGERYYTEADATTVARGLELLSAGLPLSELLSLARDHDRVMREIAQRAVDVFIRFVRDPLIAQHASSGEAPQKLVEAFNSMLPATTDLVSRHFERLLIREGLARLAEEGDAAELEAVHPHAEGSS
ncbi:MAG: MerR family transcriptional regulator [Actinomycetota bacterium]